MNDDESLKQKLSRKKINIINPDSDDYVKIRPFLMNYVDIKIKLDEGGIKKKKDSIEKEGENFIRYVCSKDIVDSEDFSFNYKLMYPGIYPYRENNYVDLMKVNLESEQLNQGDLVNISLGILRKRNDLSIFHKGGISEDYLDQVLENEIPCLNVVKFDYVSMNGIKSLYIPFNKLKKLFKLRKEDVKNFIISEIDYINFHLQIDSIGGHVIMKSIDKPVTIGVEKNILGDKLRYSYSVEQNQLPWIDIPKKYLSLETMCE